MTAFRDLKRIIRERQSKTGESYTAARVRVMRERAALWGEAPENSPASEPERVEAVVLKVNRLSARVRILGEIAQLTFRSGGIWQVVPGHRVTLAINKRWTWKGDPYASGQAENPRIAVDQLGLQPLPLHGGELIDLCEGYEPYRKPDPYAPLWRTLTARPRPDFQMDPIAWGEFPGADLEDNPTCEAAELAEAGDALGARELLMETLALDLRCLDAHAHLGNLEFDYSPQRAIVNYEMGMRIGELSLPEGFEGLLRWGHITNRPYLRCLHGYALCLWRLGQRPRAEQVFERILSLNPPDNQGVRFCLEHLRAGNAWNDLDKREAS
jgi:tetratricopeptide (TPR) repeat protein